MTRARTFVFFTRLEALEHTTTIAPKRADKCDINNGVLTNSRALVTAAARANFYVMPIDDALHKDPFSRRQRV